MKYSYAIFAFASLAAARPVLDSRQTQTPSSAPATVLPPAPPTSESFAQASAILGGLASGLKSMTWVPFGVDSGKALEGLAKGLGSAGQATPPAAISGKAVTVPPPPPGPPPPPSPQDFAQASSILSGIASGLQGMSSVPFAADSGKALAGLAHGLGAAGHVTPPTGH